MVSFLFFGASLVPSFLFFSFNALNPRQTSGIIPGYCIDNGNGPTMLSTADVVVPYRFCEDFRNGSSSLCNIFDSGADELEVVTRLIEDYEN